MGDVCSAFDLAPHLLVAGAASASPLNEKLKVNLPFLDGTLAPSRDGFARSGFPSGVWGAFWASRVAVVSRPGCSQMDEEGQWENGTWADSLTGRQSKLQFQGEGTRT